MKQDLYRKAITESWSLVWQHKILWIFGLFATFLGQMGLEELFVRIGLLSYDSTVDVAKLDVSALLQDIIHLGQQISSPEAWMGFIWLVLMLAGLGFFILFISLVSQGTLIHLAAQYMASKRKKIDVGKAWHVGVYHSWKLLILNGIKWLFVSGMLSLSGWLSWKVAAGGGITYILLLFLSILLTVSVGLVFSFLVIYAASYIIIEHRSLKDAILGAWELFSEHKIVSLEVGLIVIALNMLYAFFVLACVLLLISIPSFFVSFLFYVSGSTAFLVAGAFLGTIFSMLLMFLFGAIFTAYITTVWTYLFVHMHKRGISSRLLGFFKKLA